VPPQIQYVYVPKPGPPGWLVTIGVAAVACLLVGGFYYYVSNRNAMASGTPATPFEAPKEAAPAQETAAPKPQSASKYLEAAGVRIFEDAKKARIRFLLVNHAAADLADLKGTVAVIVKDGDREVGTLPFSLDQLRAFEAKEVEGPLKTSLRAYELPDWQYVRVEIRLKE
jgi:hypothetical protein